MQSPAEIFNIIEGWKIKCPREWFLAGTNMLKKEYEDLLDKFVNEKFNGVYSTPNLDLALAWVLLSQEHKAELAAMQHQFKVQLAEEAWKKRVAEVQRWVESHPNCRQDDEAIGVIRDFFAAHPEATIDDWNTYTLQHPDDARLFKKPSPLVLNVRNKTQAELQEMRRVYGDAPVDAAFKDLEESMQRGLQKETWRESPEDKQKRYAKEAAEEKERQRLAAEKAEARMKYVADAIVDRFQGKSHSESFWVRDTIREILVYKPDDPSVVDWKVTAQKRAEFVRAYECKNPSVIPADAR